MSGNEKLCHLPGTSLTPEYILAKVLENARAGEIKHVYVGYLKTNGVVGGYFSAFENYELYVHQAVMNNQIQKSLRDIDDG